jgi:light-regulated signal transduction histidine kinase (bacteriophytochrome)/HPt (histidine-containing phosphotransfer) domain-containing protein
MVMRALQPRVDLTGCEREPVHIPGAIQPHGVLLVVDPGSLTIVAVSDNTATLLDEPHAMLLGRPIASIAVESEREELVEGLRRADIEERNPFKLTTKAGRMVSVSAHAHDGRILLECEPEDTAPELQRAYVHNRVRQSLARLRATSTLRDLCQQTAREVRLLTGFDRILVYAFQPDWTGEVLAEECATGSPRYLGLRFPASDIPSQARALYAACRLRTVPTSSYVPARILGLTGERPLDLTHANLRSISPVHLEYMRNMGVTASLGISLMDGDRLWGLITCNHESGERFIPYDARTACSLVGEVASSLIARRAGVDFAEERAALLHVQGRLVQYVVQDADVVRGLTQHSPSIVDVTRATGAALVYKDEIYTAGTTPPREAIVELVGWLDAQPANTFVAESLPARYPAALAWKDTGCGLVASRIAFSDGTVVSGKNWILWFRPEVIQTVSWGGDPTKQPVSDGNARLHPRKSFDRWREDVHLKCIPFLPAELHAATSFTASLTDVILEIEAARQIRQNAILLDASNRELRLQIEENQRVRLALQARTDQLRSREQSLQLVLDATGDGFISVARDGTLLEERSRGFEQQFTVPTGDAPVYVWDVLFDEDSESREELALMWTQLTQGRIPFEVAVDQMCRELTHKGRRFEVDYKAVREGEKLSAILVKLEDVTERAAARIAALEAQETQAILACVLRDARGFGRTLGELSILTRAVSSGCSPAESARALHTLKGNASVLGLASLAERCHELEGRMADRDGDIIVSAEDMRAVEAELARVVGRVRDLVEDGAFERIEVPIAELKGAICELERGGDRAVVLRELQRWTLEPASRPLGKLAARARRLALDLGKKVEIVVMAGDVRVDGATFEPLWNALTHAVSNAVDHGIETTAIRLERGKAVCGRLVLSAEDTIPGWMTVAIADDGAGVDLGAVRNAAERRGLHCTTRAELLGAIFLDSVSTCGQVTATSGRGVGLAALREVCAELGGSVEIETEDGVGTTLRVRVPTTRTAAPLHLD